jgi:F-type H+-transporting ATPase subunit delta
MKMDPVQLARILVESTAHQSDVSGDMKTFVAFLAEHGQLNQWREIEKAIDQIWKEKFGASSIRVLSAHELTDEARKVIEEIAPGADLSTAVDERLIGGAIIRIDDKRIDGSITGQLRTLRKSLLASV